MPRISIGPGPANYKLPPLIGKENHDFTKFCYPAYSMGVKTPGLGKILGPGPKYNLDRLTTYGKASPPEFSIKSRHPDLSKVGTPGPGAYRPENVPPMTGKRPPCYSMFSRHAGIRNYDISPGPNAYELPSTIGPRVPNKPAKAAYSMSFRQKKFGPAQTPGPAAYGPLSADLYKPKLPHYSIASKVYPPAASANCGPGPIYKPKWPEKSGYSFGLRTDVDPYITAADNMPCMQESNNYTC